MVEQLGFSISKKNKKYYMTPPKGDFLTLTDNINKKLDQNIKKGLIKETDVLRPAIFFTRDHNGKTEYRFHAMGQDKNFPQKSNGWRLFKKSEKNGLNGEPNIEEISAQAFDQALSEGKFPLGPNMWHHDIGHFTEMIAYPKYARIIKKYRRQLHLKQKKEKTLNSKYRSYIALEASSTVNFQKKIL